jgi:PPM family protein phosphatase
LKGRETLNLQFAAATDPGRVRSRNEDRFVADGGLRFFAVVDGMGGHTGGDVASITIAEAVTTFIRETAVDADGTWPDGLDGRLSALANRLQVAIRSANRALAVRAQDNAALDGSGATVAAVLFGNDDVAISHVGDCRVYLLRNGVLTQMTRDHSVVAEQIAMGLLEPEAARTHPLRHVVTRAVSGQAGMTVDTLELKVEPGDRLLLCSDGIHGVLTDKEIEEIVADRQRPLEEVCRAAIDRVNTRGGPDNSTAVVVEAS